LPKPHKSYFNGNGFVCFPISIHPKSGFLQQFFI